MKFYKILLVLMFWSEFAYGASDLIEELRKSIEIKNIFIAESVLDRMLHPSFQSFNELEPLYKNEMYNQSDDGIHQFVGMRIGDVVIQGYIHAGYVDEQFVEKIYKDSKEALSLFDEKILRYAGLNVAHFDRSDGFDLMLSIIKKEDFRFKFMVQNIILFCSAYDQKSYDYILSGLSGYNKDYAQRHIEIYRAKIVGCKYR